MSIEDIAQRFSSRDGLCLRDYVEVALPVYHLRLRAITIAHKNVPPIEEFILRALAMEICSFDALAAFLGLDERVLQPALLSLIDSDDVVANPAAGDSEFALTPKGKITAAQHVMSTTEERTFPLYFDALTRKSLWYRNEQLIDYREMKSKGPREIANYPSVRPKAGDLRVAEIDAVLKSLHASTETRRDLVAIRGIESCRKWFVPALALIYSREGNTDLQVGVVIGGKLSSEHERVLPSLPSFSDFLKDAIPVRSEVQSDLASVEEDNSEALKTSEELQSAIAEAHSKKAVIEDGLSASAATIEENELRERLGQLEEEIVRLSAEAGALPVRNLYVYDHPLLLRDALKSAKKRLLIISPWIRGEVVDKDFLKDLEILLKAGVDVYVGHGISANATRNPKAADAAAKVELEQLAASYPNLHFVRIGNTHAKVLIKDHEFAAITSFNWLSFRGDPNKTYRDEQGVLLQRRDLVDSKFAEVVQPFS
ncbi:MAG: phospholipase D-like domain-containing protein [Acidobacteriota bacterium]|nr:phospholipase D-like domain-containing protein [Acidobacteriota bacterium]